MRAADIRTRLGHPIIDGDGHWLEPIPVFLDYLREAGGASAVDAMRARWQDSEEWHRVGWPERHRKRLRRTIWWGVTADTYDKATSLLPALLAERLPELGVDFAILYPTFGLTITLLPGDLRTAAARAYNDMTVDLFAPHLDRFAPVAIIPTLTPDEALAELEYAVGQRGYRAIMLRGNMMRRVGSATDAVFADNIALDSPYDYEPLWARCEEFGVAVTQHAGSTQWSDRASISNFTYNHIGHFAESNHAFARGVFLGGVPRRHARLNFGFMEGGAGWACTLLADLQSHWEKRRLEGLQYPSRQNTSEISRLIAEYGPDALRGASEELMRNLDGFRPERSLQDLEDLQDIHDDFEACAVRSKAELRDMYTRQFYFGCEADDPATMWAFDPRFGARLRPLFSSDFTHFDVPHFDEVVPEAYEMVEKGWLTEADFRDFTFANAARLHATNNPAFFAGTVVEAAVTAELGLAAV
ncbi:MAG: amidohydrolase family protein [Chloroflexi bacterium]|nr:amidohydrolase family protein [Chloroflexota bacterium]